MKVLLAGLWARRGLNAAALLMTVIALTAAVLGPMYGRASAEHLVDSRIVAQPHYATGLSLALPAAQGRPSGGLEEYEPPEPMALVDEASSTMAGEGVDRYWGPERRWLRDPGHTMRFNDRLFTVPLYWREGMCELAEVSGRCPEATDEVLVQETMAETMGVGAGDSVELGFEQVEIATRRAPGGHEVFERTEQRTRSFTVVGTYRIEDPTTAAWYDESRVLGYERLDPSMPTGTQAIAEIPTPPLLVAPASMTTQTFVGGVDRVVDTSAVDLDTMAATETSMQAFVGRVLETRAVDPAQDLQLGTIFEEVRTEHEMLSRVMVAALAPLVVLALLLLFALVSAGATARRPYVALAKLRGHSRGQVFRFAVGEPFLVVAVATPLAFGIASGAAHVIARRWLVPGIPVVADTATWLSLTVVVSAALGASVVAALDVMREPLSRALASALALRSSSRVALVLRSAVVALALAVLLQLLTGSRGDGSEEPSQLLALLAPLFLALAVAVAGAALLRVFSRWWVGRTATSGSTPGYLASRRLARRPDLANLMIPLLLAVSVISFAASASAVSEDWRVSRARAEVGAPRTFGTEVSAGRLLHVTRDVDPDGRYLAAAVVEREGDEMARRLFVDSTRLSAVAAWDETWSDVPVREIQEALSPQPAADRLAFRGKEVSLTLAGVSLKSATDNRPSLWLQYANEDGEQRSAELGVVRNDKALATLTGTVNDCAGGCLVEKIFLTGESMSVLDVNGRLTLTEVAVDGEQVDWGLARPGAWRPARPFPVSLVDPPVVLEPSDSGLGLRVFLGQLPPGEGPAPAMVSGFAAITPATTSDIVPVVVVDGTETRSARIAGSGNFIEYDEDVVVGTALNGQLVPMDVVARVEALPLVGTQGAMADLETSLVEFEPPPGAVVVPQLWAAADTPADVLDAVRDQGVALTPIGNVEETLSGLRSDAFSLGLRLFLIVGVATLLLAVFGVFASAVLQSRWRSYEVASLRVVGVPQRRLVRASVLEYVVMLGVAVVLGVLSAWLAVQLVLPSVSLGPADDFEPAPVYASHAAILGGVGLLLFGLATLIALVVSRRTTRLGRPATLRWAEQT